MPSRRLSTLLISAIVLCLSCTLVAKQSVSKYRPGARPVGDGTLSRIEPGVTTRGWLLAALGKPTYIQPADEDVEIFTYEARKTVTTKSYVFLIWSSSDNDEVISTTNFEIKAGVVTRYWRDDG
ncbi:MAG: hypothetical protein O6952_08550 [Planctomycetota bacterium]|nr:hypothetical protein [Planctomycetota bacterium]